MIAYNTQWLDALSLQKQVRKWFKQGLINQAQWQEVQAQFATGFYLPNFFVRIGLFFFCWIMVSSVFGLIGMTLIEAISNSTSGIGVVMLLFGAGLFAMLEVSIRDRKFYCAGIDDALLYMAIGLAISGICLLFEPLLDNHLTLYFLISLPFLGFGAIRYTDRLLTFLSYVCAMAVLFLILESNSFTRMIIPFVCMAFSAVVYLMVRKNKQREYLRFWMQGMLVIEACSLITFYLSGNYFIVKELGEELFPGYRIPFAFLFFITTAAIPIVYVYTGLKNKDRLRLRIGLLLIAASVLTFKYYFSLGHYEITLTIAGVIMVAGAYFCIRLLKHKHYGFTYQEDLTSVDTPDFAHAEALLVAQTFGPQATPEKEFEFGGGQFGGGGAGGNF